MAGKTYEPWLFVGERFSYMGCDADSCCICSAALSSSVGERGAALRVGGGGEGLEVDMGRVFEGLPIAA